MKLKFLVVLGICISLFTQFGCSNEIEVIGIWKDIPVVYAVINETDSVNYIRVERAYLPPNRSALEVAKIPDSLYFDTADVDVVLYYINIHGDTVLWGIPLEYVDLVNEGIVRDSGMFAHQPSYAYKVLGKIPKANKVDYLLKIENHKTGNTFWARTERVDNTNASPSGPSLITTPSYSLQPYRPIAWRELTNQGDTAYATLTVEMTPKGFAAIYDYKFRFHYKEYQIDNQGNQIPSSVVNKSVEWKAASDFIPPADNQTKRIINGEAFYQFLGSALSNITGTNTRRCAGHLEVYVDGGSESLMNYIIARQANEGYVEGLYPSAPYSNVSGGYGVFASADRIERKDRPSDPKLMRMSALTYEYLKYSKYTKNLGFQSVTPCY